MGIMLCSLCLKYPTIPVPNQHLYSLQPIRCRCWVAQGCEGMGGKKTVEWDIISVYCSFKNLTSKSPPSLILFLPLDIFFSLESLNVLPVCIRCYLFCLDVVFRALYFTACCCDAACVAMFFLPFG